MKMKKGQGEEADGDLGKDKKTGKSSLRPSRKWKRRDKRKYR